MHRQLCGQGFGRRVVCEAAGRASFSFSLLPAANRVFGTVGLRRAVGTASAFPDGWGRVLRDGVLQGWPWFQNLRGSPGGRPPLAKCWCEPFHAVSLFICKRGLGGNRLRFCHSEEREGKIHVLYSLFRVSKQPSAWSCHCLRPPVVPRGPGSEDGQQAGGVSPQVCPHRRVTATQAAV